MMVFDRKGQENFNNHALRNPASEETDKLGTLGENVDLAWDVAKYQHTGLAESLNYRDKIKDQFNLLYDLTGDEQYNTRFLSHQVVGAKKKAGETQLKDFDLNKRFYEEQHDTITKLQLQYPDSGLVTWNQMSEKRNAELKQDNIDLQNLQDRSQTSDVLLGNVASMGAYFMDPELLATLPFSGGASVGGRIAQNAWRSFKIESGLAFVSESVIAPKVYDFQHQIGNEQYGLKDAAIRIMTATLAAGVIRSGGSVTIDLSKIAIAKAKLLKHGKVQEAHVLDFYAKSVEDASVVANATGKTADNPEVAHVAAQTKVAQAFEKGEPVAQKDLDNIVGSNESVKVDPREIQVDAETFQYKADTDEFGVSKELLGVKKWEPMKADSILLWERVDGTRFVADGHQRLALAKRLIGEDAQEVGLSAFILREKDGFSPAFVREYAALRNIADNKGTAIDAAKVLRGAGKGLEDLPPNSTLAQNARGLALLDDASFKMIIDEVISHKYGAIVGELIEDSVEQAAVIRALSKTKPANTFQARLMVEDMKAAGFSTTKTDDLFGGVEITESLFKERAKVIDSTMKKIKKDKAVFKTLAEQESKITEAGNILDTQANIARLTDDEKTLAILSALANSKGPISDVINAAARRVKDGETVAKATKDLLPEVKKAVERGFDARPGADGAGDVQPTLVPEKGKPIQLQRLDAKTRRGVELNFKAKQKGLTVKQYYEAAKGPQKEIVNLGKELEKTLGGAVAFLSPGVKKLEAMRGKIKRKGYEDASNFTDVCRCGFAVKDASSVEAIINRISKDYEILDEGLAGVPGGYFDQKILVRFDNGIVGEVQIWEPHLLAAKEGAELVEATFPDHLKTFISDMDIPAKNKSGHALYDQQKKLVSRGKVKKGKQPEYDQIDKDMELVYASAKKSANASWKSDLDSSRPDSRISTGETRTQSSPGTAENQPSSKLSDGSTVTAGRPSQSKNAETSLKSNDAIDKTSRNIITQEALDHAERQKIINDIQEGEMILGSGKKVDGTPYDKDYLTVVQKQVDKQKQRLAQDDVKKEDPQFEEVAIPDKSALEEYTLEILLKDSKFKSLHSSKNKSDVIKSKLLLKQYLLSNYDDLAEMYSIKQGVDNLGKQLEIDKQTVIKTGEIDDLDDIRINEAQQLLDEVGDMEVVSGVRSSGKGDVELEFKAAKEVFEEIDNEQKIVDDLFKCVGGANG